MRPPRSDIAAPEFPFGIQWVGGDPGRMGDSTAAGPVLVHFLDFAQLNSVRTLPYVVEWHRRYSEPGLTLIGVQAPRFEFGADPQAVGDGLGRLGVDFPVAIDSDREMWLDYGCTGWPSLFLWGRGGALRWYHFGEGEYRATEEAIQQELRGSEALQSLPQPMDPLRETDAPGARVMPPTPELFPAGEGKPWEPSADEPELALEYEAGGAFATVDGEGQLGVELDGAALEPVRVDGAFLYELASHRRHQTHSLVLRPDSGLRVWSVSFAAGMP